MKFLAVLFFAFASVVCHAQFKSGRDNMCSTRYVNSSQEMVENIDANGLDIFPMEFKFDDTVSVKSMNNLECLYFEFSFSPEASQEAKKQFIEELKLKLDQFEFLFRNENMKAVYFHIGEQIFMSDAEVKKSGNSYNKRAEINLNNAWEAFGAQLQMKHPHLKFYAENWGW